MVSTPIDYLEAATPESSGVLASFGTLVPLFFFSLLLFSLLLTTGFIAPMAVFLLPHYLPSHLSLLI